MLLGNRTQADKDYYDSLPNASVCGYGLIQVSKRRWAIVTCHEVATVYFGCREVPRYTFVKGMENLSHDQAVEGITALCQARELEILQAHLKNGTRYLDTLTDKELGRLPNKPIYDAGLQDYVLGRLSKKGDQEK